MDIRRANCGVVFRGVLFWAHVGGMIAGAILPPLMRHPDVVLFECVREADAA